MPSFVTNECIQTWVSRNKSRCLIEPKQWDKNYGVLRNRGPGDTIGILSSHLERGGSFLTNLSIRARPSSRLPQDLCCFRLKHVVIWCQRWFEKITSKRMRQPGINFVFLLFLSLFFIILVWSIFDVYIIANTLEKLFSLFASLWWSCLFSARKTGVSIVCGVIDLLCGLWKNQTYFPWILLKTTWLNSALGLNSKSTSIGGLDA